MGKLRNRVITEKRIYDDPQHPETSDYDVSLPRTVPKAVHDPETGETLDVTMKRVSKTASDALAAAKAAQGTADTALETAEADLSACIDDLQQAVLDNDHEVALSLEKRAEMLLVERNQLCKLEKQSTH